MTNPDQHRTRLREIAADLHQNPSLSGQEADTCARIVMWLARLDVPAECVDTAFGVRVRLGRQGTAAPVRLRVPIDALPIHEATGLAYASVQAGVMHACGHDATAAAMIVLAGELARPNGGYPAVELWFQPEEETLSGARQAAAYWMPEQGMGGVLGSFHLSPALPVGSIACMAGPVMAGVDNFEVVFGGGGGHAAAIHLSCDTLMASASLAAGYRGLVANVLDPRDAVSVLIGQINGGSADNIVATETRLKGTLRFHCRQAADKVSDVIGREVARLAERHSVAGSISWTRDVVPPVVNHPNLADAFRSIVASRLPQYRLTDMRRSFAAEDVGILMAYVPSIYWFVGSGTAHGADGASQLHTPTFSYADEALVCCYEAALEFIRGVDAANYKGGQA